jgi:hypothetical protein
MRLESIKTLTVRRDAKIRLLAGIGPVIGGSVAAVKIRCGNPNCRCASGERHESTILCKKVGGKSTSIHVPRDLIDEVRAWSNEHKRVKKLLKEISDLSERIVRLHVQTKRAAAKNVARASKILPVSSD